MNRRRSLRPNRILRCLHTGVSGLDGAVQRIRPVSGRTPIRGSGSCHTRQQRPKIPRLESPVFSHRILRRSHAGVSARTTPESPDSRTRIAIFQGLHTLLQIGRLVYEVCARLDFPLPFNDIPLLIVRISYTQTQRKRSSEILYLLFGLFTFEGSITVMCFIIS